MSNQNLQVNKYCIRFCVLYNATQKKRLGQSNKIIISLTLTQIITHWLHLYNHVQSGEQRQRTHIRQLSVPRRGLISWFLVLCTFAFLHWPSANSPSVEKAQKTNPYVAKSLQKTDQYVTVLRKSTVAIAEMRSIKYSLSLDHTVHIGHTVFYE